MIKVVIFGLQDLAELADYYIKNDPEYKDYEIVGFTVHKEYIKDTHIFKGKPVFPFEDLEKYFPPKPQDGIHRLFAPIIDNKTRKEIFSEGLSRKYKFMSYISSESINYSSFIGRNCFIQEGNNLQPFTQIMDNCVIWGKNHIGHHSTIEESTFITSNVTISGHCLVKYKSYLGVGCILRDGITIGENCVIGMGAVVTKSTEPNKTYIGFPAKPK